MYRLILASGLRASAWLFVFSRSIDFPSRDSEKKRTLRRFPDSPMAPRIVSITLWPLACFEVFDDECDEEEEHADDDDDEEAEEEEEAAPSCAFFKLDSVNAFAFTRSNAAFNIV